MSVRFGGTVADFTIDSASGAPKGNATFAVYTNTGLTTAAVLYDIGGSGIGNVVTSHASGIYVFDAPDGTGALYVSDGAGSYIVLTPRPDLVYARVVGGVVVAADGTPVTGTPSPDARFVNIDARQHRFADPYYPDQFGRDLVIQHADGGPQIVTPDAVPPVATTFTEESTPDQGWMPGHRATEGTPRRLLDGWDTGGVYHRWSQTPIVPSGDSMSGVAVIKALNPGFAASLNRVMIDQATSGDLAEWIPPRLGAKPAAVTVLDGRQTAPVVAGTIPASGPCNVTIAPQLGATVNPYRCVIGGVPGVFVPTQNTGSPDPLAALDPGSIAFNYVTGVFTRDVAGFAVIVEDGTPLQTGTDYATRFEYRRGWPLIQPSRHNFFRRYQKVTVTGTGGSFTLAAGATVTGSVAWSGTDATLATNIQAALTAVSGFSGVTVSPLSGMPGQTSTAGQFQVNWSSSDTPLPLVVASSSLTSGTVTLGHLRTGTDDTVAAVAAMVADLTDDARAHALVFDIGPFPGEEAGTAKRVLFDDCNAALREVFGPMFLPIWALMRNPAVVLAVGATPFVASTGQTTTNDDATAIAARMTPASLLDQTGGTGTPTFSGGHPGPFGAQARNLLISQYLTARGINWTEAA